MSNKVQDKTNIIEVSRLNVLTGPLTKAAEKNSSVFVLSAQRSAIHAIF